MRVILINKQVVGAFYLRATLCELCTQQVRTAIASCHRQEGRAIGESFTT